MIQPEHESKVNHASYNQTGDFLVLCSDKGISIQNTKTQDKVLSTEEMGTISIARMAYNSNLIALVGGGVSPRFEHNKAIIWDLNSQKPTGEIIFQSQIKNILVKSDLLVVILTMKIYTFHLHNLKYKRTYKTSYNPNGLACINYFGEYNILAIPYTKGQVQIDIQKHNSDQDATYQIFSKKIEPKKQILQIQNYETQLHNNNIQCMVLSRDGRSLASASTKGTLIKIYSFEEKKVIMELRRGTLEAQIAILCFQNQDKYLACLSNTGTLHVFNLELKQNTSSKFKIMKPIFSYFGSSWSQISYSDKELKDKTAYMAFVNNQLRLVTQDGVQFSYELDEKKQRLAKYEVLL